MPLNVATLALGSRPMQGLAKLQAKSEARKSHFMFSGVGKWTCTLGIGVPMDF
jgi:hypothetical protein